MDKSAGIEIENIPIGITRDDLVALFEKELKDENEIKYILFPLSEDRNSAFVCFKQSPDKAFIERLAAHNPAWSVTVGSRMQTYSCCTAEVDALIVASLPDIPGCIAMLQKDYGIDASYDDDSGKFLLKGMMHQLQCAQVRLDSTFKEQLALQKMQLLEIGISNDTSAKRYFLDNDDRQGSGKTEGKMGSTEDVQKGRCGVVVEDQLEDERGRTWNRFTEESEYRSLPAAPSSLHRDDFYPRRSREHEREPKSAYTYADRTKFLLSFDHNRSNRAGGSVSLPYFSERRATDDSPHRTGDHRLDLQFDKSTGPPSSPEHVQSSDLRRYDSRGPERVSGLSKKVDASTSCELDWRKDKDRAYPADEPVIRREYESTYTSKSRAPPLSDLVPDRESVSHKDSIPVAVWNTRSPSSEQFDRREEIDVSRDSRNEPAFWKDRLDNSERLRLLPADFFPEVLNSRSDDPQVKAPDRSTLSRSEAPSTTKREQSLTEHWSENPRDLSEDADELLSSTSEDEKTLFLETYVVRYIMDIEILSVQSMKRRYKVEIKVSTEPSADFTMVVITGLEGPHSNQVERASKKFAELYEQTFNGIIQREVSVNADLPAVAVVVERVRKMYRVIAITDVAGTVALVGEFRDVMKAVDTLNNAQAEVEAADKERGLGNVNLRSSGRLSGVDRDVDRDEIRKIREIQDSENTPSFRGKDTSRHVPERSERSPDGRSSELKSSSEKALRRTEDNFSEVGDVESRTKEPRSSASASVLVDTSRYMMTFKDDFQVFVYPGDITKMRLDVIVNAANSFLKNYSGVAGAIEDAGGPQFKKACEDFYNSHGPLEMSEVTHTVATGDLRCRNVIHAVGPQWYFDTDEDKCAASLLTTFTNVLSYAEQTLNAQSLALPAIGTGVYGVPVDLCARAIYAAINEFLDSSTSSLKPMLLKSVHVVNKDHGTTELIQAVFEGLRQLELDQRTTSRPSRSPRGYERSSEETSFRRPCSERKLAKSIGGKDDTPGRDRFPRRVVAERKKNSGSHSGSEVDESKVVEGRRVDRRRGTGNAETTTKDAASAKKGFRPIVNSDSDEY